MRYSVSDDVCSEALRKKVSAWTSFEDVNKKLEAKRRLETGDETKGPAPEQNDIYHRDLKWKKAIEDRVKAQRRKQAAAARLEDDKVPI